MKRIVRNILITACALLIAGFITAINFDFRQLIPSKNTGPCFDGNYWNKKAGKHPKQVVNKNLEDADTLLSKDLKWIDAREHLEEYWDDKDGSCVWVPGMGSNHVR